MYMPSTFVPATTPSLLDCVKDNSNNTTVHRLLDELLALRQFIADERAGGSVIVFKSGPELRGRDKPHLWQKTPLNSSRTGLKVKDGRPSRRSTTLEGSSRRPDSPGIKEGGFRVRKRNRRLLGHYDNSSPGGSHPLSSSAVAIAGKAVRKDPLHFVFRFDPSSFGLALYADERAPAALTPQGGTSL
ncbi:hypothetical protein BDZ89DRAFT_1055049 [Hymenopellis radicata]|nr:hypothetical protein BDZ89DRAFT_1055049 [Hymenopellis radicata]